MKKNFTQESNRASEIFETITDLESGIELFTKEAQQNTSFANYLIYKGANSVYFDLKNRPRITIRQNLSNNKPTNSEQPSSLSSSTNNTYSRSNRLKASFIYELRLDDNTKLGDATVDVLERNRDRARKLARGNQQTANFYESIITALRASGKNTPNEGISVEEAENLYRQAYTD